MRSSMSSNTHNDVPPPEDEKEGGMAPDPLIYTPPAPKPGDEKECGSATRFLGDTLAGRFASMYA